MCEPGMPSKTRNNALFLWPLGGISRIYTIFLCCCGNEALDAGKCDGVWETGYDDALTDGRCEYGGIPFPRLSYDCQFVA